MAFEQLLTPCYAREQTAVGAFEITAIMVLEALAISLPESKEFGFVAARHIDCAVLKP